MSLLADTITLEVKVRGRPCVVVGTGEEALRKIERLVGSGAVVTVFTGGAVLETELFSRVVNAGGAVKSREATLDDLREAWVTFVDPMFEALGAEVLASESPSRLLCTLDRPEHATFINPATSEVSGLRVSISSGGVAPSVVKQLRQDLDRILDNPGFASLMRKLAELRPKLPRGERGRAIAARTLGLSLVGHLVLPSADEPD